MVSVWFDVATYNRVYNYYKQHTNIPSFSKACCILMRKGLDAMKDGHDINQLYIQVEAYKQECWKLAEKVNQLERELRAPLATLQEEMK